LFSPQFFFSSAIDEALDKIAKTPANAYVIRKIRPLLPSYGGDYTGVFLFFIFYFLFFSRYFSLIRKIRPLPPSYGGDYTGVGTLGLV
jgi:hypothetical protein